MVLGPYNSESSGDFSETLGTPCTHAYDEINIAEFYNIIQGLKKYRSAHNH